MKLRKLTSLTALISFVLLVLTSVVLYIVPKGKVAYWADWRLWGLSKTDWGNIHINLGLLFLLSIFLHVYYNWKPVLSYLKNKSRELRIFTREFNVAFVVSAVVISGTFFNIAPFRWVITLGDDIKQSAAVKYGEPPYGHAELSSLATLSSRLGIDLAAATARMKKEGITFRDKEQSLLEIAAINKTTPREIYRVIRPVKPNRALKGFPEKPTKGFGKRRLGDICGEYGLNADRILRAFGEHGAVVTPDMTIREIAAKNDLNPMEVREIIRGTAKPESQ